MKLFREMKSCHWKEELEGLLLIDTFVATMKMLNLELLEIVTLNHLFVMEELIFESLDEAL